MSATVQWIPVADAGPWRDALRGLDHGFTHLPGYSAAAARVTGHDAGLWCWQGEGGSAACPLLRRPAPGGGFDVATPLGFGGFALTGDTRALAGDWTRYWRAQGALSAYVQFAPWREAAAWRAALPGFAADLAPSRECLVWDLRPDPARLLSAMSATHRNLLRRAPQDRLCTDATVLRPAFDALYADFVERRGIGGAYRYTPAAIADLAAEPGALWVGARAEDGAIDAVMLVLWHQPHGDVFLVAASEAGRGHSRALYWNAALRLRELGVEALNLGGGVTDGDALAAFKRGLGATPRPTVALRQVMDPEGFERVRQAAGSDPPSGRFPPWLPR